MRLPPPQHKTHWLRLSGETGANQVDTLGRRTNSTSPGISFSLDFCFFFCLFCRERRRDLVHLMMFNQVADLRHI